MNFAPSSAVNRAAFWVSRFPSSPVTRAASRFSHVKPQLTAISPAPIKFYLCNPVYVHRGAPLRATADLTPAEKVGSVVANLFPFWTFLFSGLAIWRPSLLSWFTGPVIVYALGATMLAMGLTLKVDDFKSVAQQPRRVAVGATLQYTIMPLLGLLASRVFHLDPTIAAGIVVVACCPGGTASNVVTFLAGADVALSVAMTLTSTLGAVVATPWLTKLLAGTLVPIDAVALFRDIVAVVILPVVLGIGLNTAAPKAVAKVANVAPPVATIVISLITASVISRSASMLSSAGPAVLAALVLLHGGGFAMGYWVSKSIGMEERMARTNSIEVGMQNSTLGAVLAGTHIGPLAALPCALSACTHSLLGSILAGMWRAQDSKRNLAPAVT